MIKIVNASSSEFDETVVDVNQRLNEYVTAPPPILRMASCLPRYDLNGRPVHIYD